MRTKPEEPPLAPVATSGVVGSGPKGARRSPPPLPPRRSRSRTGVARAAGGAAWARGVAGRVTLVGAEPRKSGEAGALTGAPASGTGLVGVAPDERRA